MKSCRQVDRESGIAQQPVIVVKGVKLLGPDMLLRPAHRAKLGKDVIDHGTDSTSVPKGPVAMAYTQYRR